MSLERVEENLKSAERRIAFVSQQTGGMLSEELREAAGEIREAIDLLHPREAPPAVGGVAVLFVDDEEIIRRIGNQVLSREGFRVFLASDGREALEVYNRFSDAIKCVVLDIVMPGMDGIQAFRLLRAASPGLGIILTTGYGEEEIRRRFGTLTLQGFLRKPFSAASLVEMVRSAVRHSGEGSCIEG